ncbi:hypothetical protein BGZ73_005054 [Actinomortierella ambigua]|nr:hypothetical protein BGZ73_005054 [Actinomortierella ambigua]
MNASTATVDATSVPACTSTTTGSGNGNRAETIPLPETNPKGTVGDKAFAAGTTILEYKAMAETTYATVDKIVGKADSQILNNMISLTERLVDVGKVVPFIAPAFVILKIIIDTEAKAREVDERCLDLMERINFLVSHLVVLERIHNVEAMMDTLMIVIQKVHDTLKEAAALIEAYRKQSRITRRLKMTNRQDFEQMAAKVTTCSSELMMSLQIQQTGDLSILKRVVPRDLVAEKFIRENGGQDMINSDPELVKKFAQTVNLTMSDQEMEQMQSNMQELISQNQMQIEAIIRESSSGNVADMIKAFANHQRELEAELKLTCVQCEKEYNVSTNGPESCRFHSAVGNYDRYHCCQKTSPCQKGYHQPEHHSKYPYSNFFLWSYGILAPKDTVDYWVKIKEYDLDREDDTTGQVVRVGQLLRWRSWGEQITTPLMLVNVGHVQDDMPHYMEIFDVASLEETRKAILKTGNTLIFKNAPEAESATFSKGEWVLDEETQQISGIRMTVKVASSQTPTVCIVPLDPVSLSMPDKASVQYLSRCSGIIYKPDRPYEFPETIQLGPVIRPTRLREPRTFRTKVSSSNIPILMTPAWEMVANNDFKLANTEEDRFRGTWRALNRSPLSSQKQVILLSVNFEYRLVGEPSYRPVKLFALRDGLKLPISIAPSQAVDIPWEFLVDKAEHCRGGSLLAINYAHLTIHQPLRLRVTFTDIEGEEVSFIQEYVHGVRGASLPEPEDLGFFFVDRIFQCQRTSVKITKSTSPEDYLLKISPGLMPSVKVTEVDLHRIVAKAEKTGITEVETKLGVKNQGLDCTVWALVDLSCRRVYGFKVLLYHGTATPERISASMGYAPCPLYGGDELETRPIRYAEESKIVPTVDPYEEVVVIEDDEVDSDVMIPVEKSTPQPVESVTPSPAPVSVPVPQPMVIPQEILERIASHTNGFVCCILGLDLSLPQIRQCLIRSGGPGVVLSEILSRGADPRALLTIKEYIPPDLAIGKAVVTKDREILSRIFAIWNSRESNIGKYISAINDFSVGVDLIQGIYDDDLSFDDEFLVQTTNAHYLRMGRWEMVDETIDDPYGEYVRYSNIDPRIYEKIMDVSSAKTRILAASAVLASPVIKRSWPINNVETSPGYGAREFRYLRDTMNLFNHIKSLNPPPAWANNLPRVFPYYRETTGVNKPVNLRGFVPSRNVPGSITSLLKRDQIIWKEGNTWKGSGGKVDGTFYGIPVRQDPNSYRAMDYTIIHHEDLDAHDGTYAGALNRIADVLNQQVDDANGNPSTIADEIAGLVTNGDTIAEGFVASMQTNAFRASSLRWPSTMKHVTAGTNAVFDLDRFNSALGENIRSETYLHAIVLKGMIRAGVALNRIPTSSNSNGQINYGGCGGLTRRSLIKRQEGTCIPITNLDVVNDDTMGEGQVPDDFVKQSELNTYRAIKYATNNPKILPRDTGEGVSSDPLDNTELDPTELYDGAETIDDAMNAIEDAFSAILDKEPAEVDKSLVSKILKGFKKEIRMRIANNKGVRDVQWLLSLRNKRITAEAKKNAYERLVEKYQDKFGNHPDLDDPDDPPTMDPNGGGIEMSAFDISMELPFHEEDYEPPSVTDAVATSDVLQIASEVVPGMQKLDDAPSVEEGGETYIDPTHALPGTNEFAGLFRRMATTVRDIVNDPTTPKWKLVKIRAMLARNAKSIDARVKMLENKQKEGKEITQQEINEYEALTAFHESVSASLKGKDISGMPETPEDTAKIDAMSEYTPDPRRVVSFAKKPVFKAQKGKPAAWRSGIKTVTNSIRNTRGTVNSKHGTAKGGTSI